MTVQEPPNKAKNPFGSPPRTYWPICKPSYGLSLRISSWTPTAPIGLVSRTSQLVSTLRPKTHLEAQNPWWMFLAYFPSPGLLLCISSWPPIELRGLVSPELPNWVQHQAQPPLASPWALLAVSHPLRFVQLPSSCSWMDGGDQIKTHIIDSHQNFEPPVEISCCELKLGRTAENSI